MRMRYLRYFLAVAEALSFTRAAAQVHIEPSPLSRAIRDMEAAWGVHLIQRRAGRLRLTRAGEVFRDEARRLLAFMSRARERVCAAERGHGQLRIGLADRLAQPQLVRLLSCCREEEPATEIRILEMSAGELVEALSYGQIDAGFTVHPEPGAAHLEPGVAHPEPSTAWHREAVWWDRLALVLPRHHPLLSLSRIPLREITRYPLLLFDPESCPGEHELIRRRLFDPPSALPEMAGYVSGHEAMLMLAAAGYGIGVGLESQITLYRYSGVIVRPVADDIPAATFMLVPDRPRSDELSRFMARVRQIGHGHEHADTGQDRAFFVSRLTQNGGDFGMQGAEALSALHNY